MDSTLSTAVSLLPEQQRWFDVVQRLAAEPSMGQDEVQACLQKAVSAAQADTQWSTSGINELLLSAKKAAVTGLIDTARRTAMEALDFYAMVQRYRASSSYSEGRRLSPSSSDDKNNAAEASPSHSPTNTPRFREPTAEDRKRRLNPSDNQADRHLRARTQGSFSQANAAASAPHACTWRLQFASHTEELCHVSMHVPHKLASELPATLDAPRVRSRRGISTRGQLACPTSILQANPHQREDLLKMAHMELVAITDLKDCALVLVPYLDQRRELRVVTFLAALCS